MALFPPLAQHWESRAPACIASVNYAFEHYEIAAYKSLLTLAELTGDEPAAAILHQSLREEEAMAHWIDTHIVDTTRTFAALSQAGETAGI